MIDVSRETAERLAIYNQLLLTWNRRINLIGRSTEKDVVERHIEEGLTVVGHAPPDWSVWADLGTGGGVPGVVVAMAHPDRKVVLIESDRRKASFLKTVIREAGVSAEVINDRIEVASSVGADVVSARALAPLPKLLGYVARHLSDDGLALIPKGVGVDEEISKALEDWRFDCEKVIVQTAPGSVILKVRDISRV